MAERSRPLFFTDGDVMANEFRKKKYENTWVFATNLGFDFAGLFNEADRQKFIPLFRGSNPLFFKAFLHKGEFYIHRQAKRDSQITFLDTMNYAHLSVEKLGKIVNLPKLKKPAFLGCKPKNEREWEIIKNYNIRDSETTLKASRFLIDSFQELGASAKITIGSTTMSLWRNQYLKETYFGMPEYDLIKMFNGYYGGRTEAFGRGFFKDYNYYDINSLYPSVMLNEFPDPNYLRHTRKRILDYIELFEGMSYVKITTNYDMPYPLLPMRTKNKLLFPIGSFKGWYTHLELREAQKYGYEIQEIYDTYYFKKTCRPFDEFVYDMYDKRREYQKDNNPMEVVVKLLLNGLYGKFGQKFLERDNILPEAMITMKWIEENLNSTFDRIGNSNFYLIKSKVRPAVFCNPVWAAYITAYARLKLYDLIRLCKPIYCDTDSIITKKTLPTSSRLGKLKLEYRIKEGIIVRPKFYFFKPYHKDAQVKIKGVGTKITEEKFKRMMIDPRIRYTKFAKHRESLRRGLQINEILDIEKVLQLEDTKRHWSEPFNHQELQFSDAIDLQKQEEIPFMIEVDEPLYD